MQILFVLVVYQIVQAEGNEDRLALWGLVFIALAGARILERVGAYL